MNILLTENPALSSQIDKNAARNNLFPVFLKLEQLNVLIVGGGKIGLEKISAVLNNSPATKVTLVARSILPEIAAFREKSGQLQILEKEFELRDLNGKDLVIAATGDRLVSEQIREEATKRKILINVADTPDLCDFYLGSIVQKGDLKIAISTNGKSPTLAKRLKEVFQEALPDTQQSIDSLNAFREQLKGDFTHKVAALNKATAILIDKKKDEKVLKKRVLFAGLYALSVIALMLAGHLFFTLVPLSAIGGLFTSLGEHIDSSILLYIAGGFVAQMIDGALGMAYGVSVTTFLMSLGIPAITPAVASASMHAAEIFTTGTSSLVYMRYKNVNNKLFKTLLIPGAIGAILGAISISFISKSSIGMVKPLVAIYTGILGVIIIRKALNLHIKTRRKIKKLKPVAFFGGYLDSVGGGGWGPIVTTTLIAGGRDLRYAVGSSHVAKFFVAIISTATFIAVIGLSHWYIIFGLVTGSMIAAPISIYISNKISKKWGLILVGLLVIIVSLRNIIFAFIK
ncbi:MAG: TSUP family transporter [Bacteroidia bacterium]